MIVALKIFELCLKNDITLHSSWIPRELNVTADSISTFYDSDNWSIDNETFEYIQQNFDRFTVDRFSDNHNTKLPVFNSKYHCPGSASVNAFTTDWSLDFNWLCPPIKLVGKTINHMRFCKSRGVLFVPEWKSSFYWPFIGSFVKSFLVLDPWFISNKKLCKTVFKGFPKFKSLALLINFTV